MALNNPDPVHVPLVCAQEGLITVLCIKVTITFITDVVYIFDILTLILFCEK